MKPTHLHWVIQDNIHKERGYDELIRVLEVMDFPYSFHKVIPFVGNIEPDAHFKNPVICIGSYSMRHVAMKKQWRPGVFDMKMYNHMVCALHWKHHMLNENCSYCYFGEARPPIYGTTLGDMDQFFIRPNDDSKYFTGTLMSPQEFYEWQHKVRDLGEDDGSGLRNDTVVLIAPPKEIYQEIRCWIVDQKVVTASVYKTGDKVGYSECIDRYVIDFAFRRAVEWQPLRAYVMDIARTAKGLKIIEAQTINSCGFYAANMGKLVSAIDDMVGSSYYG
jgi:hypothetical protein